MIPLSGDHLAELLPFQLTHVWGVYLRGDELPSRDFRNEQDANPVGVIDDEFRLWVMPQSSPARGEEQCGHVLPAERKAGA
jgi:hypothetical protein